MTETPQTPAAVEYLAPLGRAYDRMVGALFRPFHLARWCVVGFSCWLARLLDHNGSGGAFNGGGGGSAEAAAPGGTGLGGGFEDWALPLALPLVGLLVLVILAVLVALLWVSSRGHFLFLDHVVLDRAAIREPWQRYGRLGDSLFLWRLGFAVATLLAFALCLVPAGLALVAAATDDPSAAEVLPFALLSGLLFLAVLVVFLFVRLFLVSFVVPLMYRDGLGAVAAWQRFLPLLRQRPVPFLLYGLLVVGLWIVVGLAVVVVGFATCCLGFLLLVLPYVGTVALLPVHYTLRAYSLEFLAQMGPGFDLGGAVTAAAAPAPPA